MVSTGVYNLVVRVYNDAGYKDSPSFPWTIADRVLSLPTHTPTSTGAVTGCTSTETAGTVFTAGWTTRPFVDSAEDKALIIAQAGFDWADEQAASAAPSYTVPEDTLAADTEYFVGWVHVADVLSLPTHTPTDTGAVTGCSSTKTTGTIYTAGWSTRPFENNAADRALIIAQNGFDWANTQAASATPSYTVPEDTLTVATEYFVGWVHVE
jgi:hypothetical protein